MPEKDILQFLAAYLPPEWTDRLRFLPPADAGPDIFLSNKKIQSTNDKVVQYVFFCCKIDIANIYLQVASTNWLQLLQF